MASFRRRHRSLPQDAREARGPRSLTAWPVRAYSPLVEYAASTRASVLSAVAARIRPVGGLQRQPAQADGDRVAQRAVAREHRDTQAVGDVPEVEVGRRIGLRAARA